MAHPVKSITQPKCRKSHLQILADQFAPSASIAHLQKTNPQEWMRQFRAWAESHDRTTPLLSDEAVSRESIYPDRI